MKPSKKPSKGHPEDPDPKPGRPITGKPKPKKPPAEPTAIGKYPRPHGHQDWRHQSPQQMRPPTNGHYGASPYAFGPPRGPPPPQPLNAYYFDRPRGPPPPPIPKAPRHAPFPTYNAYYANIERYQARIYQPLDMATIATRRPDPDYSRPDVARPSFDSGPPRRMSAARRDEEPPATAETIRGRLAELDMSDDESDEEETATQPGTSKAATTKTGQPPARPAISKPAPFKAQPAKPEAPKPTSMPTPPPVVKKERVQFTPHISEESARVGVTNGRYLEGVIRINQKNYEEAYMDNPDGGTAPDILVKGMSDRNRAFHGDTVALALRPPSEWVRGADGETKTGRVVAILEKRHSRQAVGKLKPMNQREERWALFSPNDSRVPRMMIPANELPTGFFLRPQDFEKFIYIARVRDWVVASPMAAGELVKELGESGEIGAETEGLLAEFDIDDREFSAECLACLPPVKDAQHWEIPKDTMDTPGLEEELEKRRDFRDELIFTIDPTTARDLDDALHCKYVGEDTFEVGVHIADVSHFVDPGTALDEWASERATSVYLVHRVVPMLPRLLCEQLCSLNPNVDRLAFSVVWRMRLDGTVVDEWFGRSVIRSAAKLTYDIAQGFIEEPERAWERSEIPTLAAHVSPEELVHATLRLNRVAGALRARRYEQGALRLDQPKLSFALNDDMTRPIGCSVYKIKDSNRLVEEFMLRANMAVAEKIAEAFPELAILRRHPPPRGRVLQDTLRLCAAIGYPLSGRDSASLAASLLRYVGTSDSALAVFAVLSNLCMKPMQLAQYFCTRDIADKSDWRHYALSVNFYTHFTSPIRRYPDIMVHRLLAAALEPRATRDLSILTSSEVKELRAICKRCNEKKQDAKSVGEASAEMFFALFIASCGPVEEPATVIGVNDFSLDLLLTRIGLTKRVYFKPVLPPHVADYAFEEGPPPTLTLTWLNEGSGKELKLAYAHTKTLTVVLSKGDKPLEYKAVVKAPEELGLSEGDDGDFPMEEDESRA